MREVRANPTSPSDERSERDHELRASLCGIEAAAAGSRSSAIRCRPATWTSWRWPSASEARRLRTMLAPQPCPRSIFNLVEAIRPAILMTRSLGAVICDDVPDRVWVQGCQDEVAQAVLALLDNARLPRCSLGGGRAHHRSRWNDDAPCGGPRSRGRCAAGVHAWRSRPGELRLRSGPLHRSPAHRRPGRLPLREGASRRRHVVRTEPADAPSSAMDDSLREAFAR